MPSRARLNDEVYDVAGSVTPLIIGFFIIGTLLLFLISNVSASYIERRSLTSRLEASLSDASQELNEFAYYYQGPLTEFLVSDSIADNKLHVPIDCSSAEHRFVQSIDSVEQSSGYGRNKLDSKVDVDKPAPVSRDNGLNGAVEVLEFACDGEKIRATIRETYELPFQFPLFGLTHYIFEVTAGIDSRFR
jgi:hypothetical protein